MSTKSYLYAITAVLIWSTLAILGSKLENVPSFLLVGVALSTSGILSTIKIKEWSVPKRTLLIGIGGIFGYHFLIFTAYKYSPVIEANLLNYLWPLLIVLLSPVIFPEYSLDTNHILGALLGLAGAGIIITGGKISLEWKYLPGYFLAIGAALIWAVYSLMSKKVSSFPTSAVGGFCMISGIFSLLFYLVSLNKGGFYIPDGSEWLYMFLLGLGPMGSAFFFWDMALKEGDPRVIGSITYLTPLLSTFWLILAGGKKLTLISGFAMLLLIVGAYIGSRKKT
jgi:drug/metabolite transporter (DMT)-like permease